MSISWGRPFIGIHGERALGSGYPDAQGPQEADTSKLLPRDLRFYCILR